LEELMFTEAEAAAAQHRVALAESVAMMAAQVITGRSFPPHACCAAAHHYALGFEASQGPMVRPALCSDPKGPNTTADRDDARAVKPVR
jgi:hypothetical protein